MARSCKKTRADPELTSAHKSACMRLEKKMGDKYIEEYYKKVVSRYSLILQNVGVIDDMMI